MSDLASEIKQKKFNSEYTKAIINLLFTSNYTKDIHNKLFKSFGLTTPQFNVLRILKGQHPKPATVNLLIERMIDKSSNASRIVDKLEDKGFVKRVQCRGDRRAVDVLITEEGLTYLEKVNDSLNALHDSMCNISDEEATLLNTLLDKLRE